MSGHPHLQAARRTVWNDHGGHDNWRIKARDARSDMNETKKNVPEATAVHHDLLGGLVRLHVLHHASEHEIYGQWMIEELATHGYRLSAGTLYPMLHKMERDGYLTSRRERDGRTVRKFYKITDKGREGLAVAKRQLREFRNEAE